MRLLGPPRVLEVGHPPAAPRTVRAAALLLALAAADRPLRRERLRDLLWEDAPPDKASLGLRVALSDLRRLLGDRIEADRSTVRLRASPPDLVDLRVLADWEAGRPLPEGALRDALGEGGEVLAGLRATHAPELAAWLEGQRARWAALQARCELDVAAHAEAAGDVTEAERRLRRALATAPELEEGLRRLMRLLGRQGRFGEALAAYDLGAAALARTLDVRPEPATVRLRERLLAARLREPRARPAAATPFVGREVELEQLAGWLRGDQARLVTIVGPGGAGKTRLALEAARRLEGAFLDGIVVVELEPLPAERPFDDVLARALSVGTGDASAQAAVLQALDGREMLLVLDGFEHLVDQAPRCLELLQTAPELRLLVTSRHALELRGEQRLDLAGLSWPEGDGEAADPQRHAAAMLFRQAAQRARAGFDPADDPHALGALCRRLEGLPLALELVATWASVLDCRGILEAIDREGRDPSKREALALSEPSGLDAVFRRSWDLLGPELRLATVRLAVFRGGFESKAAEAIAGVGIATLRELVRRSIVGKLPSGRFRMHAMLRGAAEARLAEQPAIEVPLRDAHARHMLARWADDGARLFGPGSRDASARMALELENADAAWRWALARGDHDAVASALGAWLRHARLDGSYARLRALLDATAERLVGEHATAGEPPAQRLLARVQGQRAYLAFRMGEGEQADVLAADALRWAEATGDAEPAAFARWVLAIRHVGEGRLDAADALLAAGRAGAEAAGLTELTLEHRWQQAIVAFYRDELAAFQAEAEALLAVCRKRQLRHLEGRVRESLAAVLSRRGEADGAEVHLAAASEIAEMLGDRLGAINVLGSRAELALHAGRLDRARPLATEALARSIDAGAFESAVVMRWGLATIELAAGHIGAAEAQLEACLEASEHGGFAYWEASARTARASARRLAGDLAAARAELALAGALWDALDQAWGHSYRWLEAGRIALASGDHGGAARALSLAGDQAALAGDPIRALEVALAQAELVLARDGLDAARPDLAALRLNALQRGAARIAADAGALLGDRATGAPGA